jgi:mxaK protein
VRRRVAQWTFGGIALACAICAAYQGWQLHKSDRVNAAVAGARVTDFDAHVPQARFARALALSRAGEFDAAIKAYKSLIGEDQGELRSPALYNLGNLYMRNAFASQSQAAQSLPLVELAKQSYRTLLRIDPTNWDARYNLELALRIAPEVEREIEEKEEPPEREQSVSTLQGARIDLP